MLEIYLKDENFSTPEDQLYYLLAANGLFLVKKTRFFIASSLVFTPKGQHQLAWLKSHKAGIRLRMSKKIPRDLIKQVISFFRKVFQEHKTEAIVLLYWSELEKSFKLVVPEQTVSLAGVTYKVGENPEDWVRVGTIHSHANMQAFHSGVDDHDEEHDDGIHITIGNMDFVPSISCSVVVDGERQSLSPSQLIEGEGEMPVPDEWMKKVSLPRYPTHYNTAYGTTVHQNSLFDGWKKSKGKKSKGGKK